MPSEKVARYGNRGNGKSTRSSAEGDGGGNGWVSVRFVAYPLSKEEKEHLKTQEFDYGRFAEWVSAQREKGYKLIQTPLNDRGFYGSTLMGVGELCINKGMAVSGEGSTPERADLSLWYKAERLDTEIAWDSFTDGGEFR